VEALDNPARSPLRASRICPGLSGPPRENRPDRKRRPKMPPARIGSLSRRDRCGRDFWSGPPRSQSGSRTITPGPATIQEPGWAQSGPHPRCSSRKQSRARAQDRDQRFRGTTTAMPGYPCSSSQLLAARVAALLAEQNVVTAPARVRRRSWLGLARAKQASCYRRLVRVRNVMTCFVAVTLFCGAVGHQRFGFWSGARAARRRAYAVRGSELDAVAVAGEVFEEKIFLVGASSRRCLDRVVGFVMCQRGRWGGRRDWATRRAILRG